MKRIFFLITLLGILHFPTTAQEFTPILQVLNPQQDWNRDQGTLEEASFTIEPKGTYAEVGMYLTFSARGSFFGDNEQLEVVMKFSLPDGAIITDSWLWVGDDIVQAMIIDRWTASGIYEEIVNRRRDPSLLTKIAPGKFELRVFPMLGKESRRVKITYLVPMDWTSTSVQAPIAFDVVSLSRNPVPNFYVIHLDPEHWDGFHISEAPELPVEHLQDELRGKYDRVELSGVDESVFNARFISPASDGVFVNTFEEEEEAWYQLAIVPEKALDLANNRRVAIVLDHDTGHTPISRDEMLSVTRSILKGQLTEKDSLNVFYSTLTIDRLSDGWRSAHSDSIDVWFSRIETESIAAYSNLPTLLAEAISFVENSPSGGEVILISSSSSLSQLETANQYIRDLQSQWPTLPPIHVVDFATEFLQQTIAGAQIFQGNSYLYTNLSRLAGGRYRHARASSFSAALEAVFSSLGATIRSFDLYTTLEGGFTFNRFSSSDGSSSLSTAEAVQQVGRYIGEFPFIVELSGILSDQPFSIQHVVEEKHAIRADSTLRTVWTGKQIELLESRSQTNDLISEIINYSTRERILSTYTAFLALEPGVLDQEPCDDCADESDGGVAISVEDEIPGDEAVQITAYPNPFSDRVRIEVDLPAFTEQGDLSFEVFDALGRRVATLDPTAIVPGLRFELTWDGTSDAGEYLASGVYFLVVSSPHGRHTLKLVLVR